MKLNQPKTVLLASVMGVALSSPALAGGMEKTPILEKSPIVAPESDCACPWGVTAQALYLKAHSNEGTFDDDQEEEFGYRVGLSYKCDDKLGYRVRYFDWEGSNDWYAEMSAIDLEVFDFFTLGAWAGQYSVGLRYATYEESMDQVDFSGWGPTVGLEMTRKLSGPWSLYTNARVSLVFGEDDNGYDDSYIPIFELGAGIQYNFSAFGNCPSYVRLGFEAQNWSDITTNNDDASLFGATAELGLSF